MTEFANGDKDQREKFFEYRLSSVRMVIDCAFSRLKARFGSLRREMNIKLDNLLRCINSCFILHNFCEMRKEGLNSRKLDKSLRLEKEFQPPIENDYKVNNNESGGKVTRQIYVMYFE